MVAVIDYDAGNITSVERALTFLGVAYCVTSNPERVATADRVIFPGVGAAGYAMRVLRERNLDEALRDFAKRGRPLLGICLGAQILMDWSQESSLSDRTELLGLIPGQVLGFPADFSESSDEADGSYRRLKVPHIGWNTVRFAGEQHGLFQGIPQDSSFYFVHSYYLDVTPVGPAGEVESSTGEEAGSGGWGWSEYGVDFVSVVGHGHVVGMQFHPEKSGPVGLQLLNNFSSWG